MTTIAWVNLRRLFRDRTNIFFVIIFPIALILVFGVAFGMGFSPRLGVAGGADGVLSSELLRSLESARGVAVHRYDDAEELRTAVERGRVTAGLVIPGDYDASLGAGRQARLTFLSKGDPNGRDLGVTVRSVITQATIPQRAALFAGGDLTAALARARGVNMPGVTVEAAMTGTVRIPDTVTSFDVAATGQLLLFVFLTSLTGASALIETRRLGVSRRMFAAPLSSGRILAGEALGRIGVALLQGLIIMLGSGVLFGVKWGDPVGAAAILLAYSLVGGGAGMLLGSTLRTEQQAVSLGLLLGLGLAALGGAMLPLDLFSGPMRQVAHVTPHAWAIDGFAELLRHDGTLVDVLPQVGVLAGFAVALFALGSWRLRISLTR